VARDGAVIGRRGPGEGGRRMDAPSAESNMHRYAVVIYWSAEDQTYLAEVPELAGWMAHGGTKQAALANANEAIRLWIDTANEFGDPIPEPKGERRMLA